MDNITMMKCFTGIVIGASEIDELHCLTANSDKRYFVAVGSQASGRFSVVALYGRSGGPYNAVTKLADGSSGMADSVKTKLIAEKIKKGYVLVTDGLAHLTPFAPSIASGSDLNNFGIEVELLTPVNTVDELLAVIEKESSPLSYLHLQRKMDGVRALVRGTALTIIACTRSLRSTILPPDLAREASAVIKELLVMEAVLDCEYVNGKLWVFDWYSVNAKETPASFDARTERLKRAQLAANTLSVLAIPVTDVLVLDKDTFESCVETYVEEAMRDGAEGIVARLNTHRRLNGRNPRALKLKFTATADVLLYAPIGRSVLMQVINRVREMVPVGRLTIPSNVEMPLSGTIAEVRYLYRAPNGPLQQPVFLRYRDDLVEKDCVDEKINRYKDMPIIDLGQRAIKRRVMERKGVVDVLW